MDMQRLHDVCNEYNKQDVAMLEIQNLKQLKPSPFDPDLTRKGYELAHWVAAAAPETLPRATAWAEEALVAAENCARAGKGREGIDERIRYLWYDGGPNWGNQLFPRLEKELGAVCMSTYYADIIRAPIDLTSEQAMFTSLAYKNLMGTPMTRQTMHPAEVFSQDVVQLCREFKCDAMVMSCHVGHRDQSAYYHIVGDLCRKNNIPFIFLGCDIWDSSYMTPDTVFDRMKENFEVMGLIK